MEKVNTSQIIKKFITKMNYLENEHVIGCVFYGSLLTGHAGKNSDLDLHIIFDNSEPDRLIRGNEIIDGIRIEYFEKPIGDVYLSAENEFHNQNNATLSIIGKSRIIFDKTGEIKKLQEDVCRVFSIPLPPLSCDEAKEHVSIINNRMERLKLAAEDGSPQFIHLYHLTIEKIRKFYHRLNGYSRIPTSKVYKIYTDKDYREAVNKEGMPDQTFVEMYLDAITTVSTDYYVLLKKAQELYSYAKRDVSLDEGSYRIRIESRNKGYRGF